MDSTTGIVDAILADAGREVADLPVPESYRGVTVHADEVEMFAGVPTSRKDPRRSLHLDEVRTPSLSTPAGRPSARASSWPAAAAPSSRASTSGYTHQYDNRHLWMHVKKIVGSHFANYREAWEANRLISKGWIHPTLSTVYSLDEAGQATYDVHRNVHQGKVGVRCLAPRDGLGVRDHELRERHLDAINRFRL